MDFNIKVRYGHFWNFQNKWHLTDFQHNFRRGKGGSRGLPSDATARIKPPPSHKSPSFHTAFEEDRSGEAQRADVFCWQKDINLTGSKEAIRSSIICKVK
ncbi:hypothetical protein AMECASPLE_029770 [Ameca splendens]|uniref:Uncharacterized protein n=1 Tax=Ameca splendens TaxID=208324 RepID=A0ABV0ZFM3_9TELE